jgi:formate--tetrahydrofolate ligase
MLKSDIEIARGSTLEPITAIAAKLNIPSSALHPYGRYIAKIDFDFIGSLADRPDGKLILVTAINPTPAGEGKTTTTIGLGDALNALGKRALICLREPSLGPVFGQKGGATGGGRSQVAPMHAINLHFTGDFHAIAAAHNLLAALIDNHIYWGNGLDIDPRRIAWRRALDMNDRALRKIIVALGGVANGYPREDGFDIVVASEVMATFCLSRDAADLAARLSRIVVAQTRGKAPVTAADLNATGAMTVLLDDALKPNLVQTLEGAPAVVHGGPFANIAHGCNSVIATRTALKLADYVVTEAGFGADLGAEKFFDIKCRQANLSPAAAVIVASVRALKMHGGVARDALASENLAALGSGLVNLERHVANMRKFGVPLVVAINQFASDTPAELALVQRTASESYGVEAFVCRHWADGSKGAEELAQRVADLADGGTAAFKPLYPDEMPLWEKVRTIATEIYRASDISADQAARKQFAELEAAGYGALPVCIAKTPYSFSADPTLLGAPSGHIAPIRELRLRAGAGFVVVIVGDVMTMPGLPRRPAAEAIRLRRGAVEGLF